MFIVFDVTILADVRPHITPDRVLGGIYRNSYQPRPEHFRVGYRILMFIELEKSLLSDVLGKAVILDDRSGSPKDGPVMESERLLELDHFFGRRRGCLG